MADTLAKMCDEVGLSEHAKKHLMVGRSFKAVMVLAKVAKSEEELVEKIFDPFKMGQKLKGVNYKLDDAPTHATCSEGRGKPGEGPEEIGTGSMVGADSEV